VNASLCVLDGSRNKTVAAATHWPS